jgi:hypothetical protein
MKNVVEVTDYKEAWTTLYYSEDADGIVRRFKVIYDDGSEVDVEIFIGDVLMPVEDDFDIIEAQEEGFRVRGDVIVMPTVEVIWDGTEDYLESNPDINVVIEQAKKRYKEIPEEYFEI